MDPNLYYDLYGQPSYLMPYPSFPAGWQYSTSPYWDPYSGRSTEATSDWKEVASGLMKEWWQTPTAATPGPALPSVPDLETMKSGIRMQANVDWKETPEAHVFIADVPGLRREDVFVQVEGRMLSIWWDQKRDAVDKWRYTERTIGSFYRDIYLPADADENETPVAVENGLLTVTVAKKKPVAKPEKLVATTVPKQEEEKPVTSVLEQEEGKLDVKPIEGSDDEFDFVVV